MNISPQKFRETVLMLLFSKDFHDADATDLVELVSAELKVSASVVKKAECKLNQIMQNLDQIDAVITKNSTSYDLNRIQRVERSILRLAVYELLYEKTLDKEIVIAEAKRLAKKFSTPEASLFCQAIVDGVCKTR